MSIHKPALVAIFTLLTTLGGWLDSCTIFTKKPDHGVVTFYDHIPPGCGTVRGLQQKVVKRVTSETELRSHYGLTFLVWFNDHVSPMLYGSLYYQNAEENRYCMALPDGRFAEFSDKQISRYKRNIVQEVCYPILDCLGKGETAIR